MARYAGTREVEAINNNVISTVGSEGNLTHVTETWIPGAKTLPSNDTFESEVLKVPGHSKLLDFDVIRNFTGSYNLNVQYQDVGTGTGRNIVTTWADLTTGGDSSNFGATDKEAGPDRNTAHFFTWLQYTRFYRLVIKTNNRAFTATDFIKVMLTYGNI